MTTPAKKTEKNTDSPARAPVKPFLGSNAIAEEAQVRRRWFVKAPAGTTQDDVRTEVFWKRAAASLGRHDLVTVLADDESWQMEVVVEKSRADVGVEISVLKVQSRTPVTSNMTMLGDGTHYVQFVPNQGYCVIRVSDGAIISGGHTSEGAATLTWLREAPRKAGESS